MLHSLKCFIGG